MNRLGEWIGWALHYFFGLVVGAGGGFWLISDNRAHRSAGTNAFADETTMPFVIGAALFFAGVGALLGDRLWMGDNYRMIAPEEPSHTPLTKVASIISIALGACFIGYALYRHVTL